MDVPLAGEMVDGPAEAMTSGMGALSMALGGFGAKRLFFGGWPSSGLVDGAAGWAMGGGYGLPTRFLGGDRFFSCANFGSAASRLARVDVSVFGFFLLYSSVKRL
jgi:hypothetical protein